MKNLIKNIQNALIITLTTACCTNFAVAQTPQNNTLQPIAENQQAAENTQNSKPKHTISDQFKSISSMIQQNMPGAADNTNTANTPQNARTTITPEARQYVDAIQKYYDNAKTYSAAFEQKYETVDGVKKTSTGTVWFKKPGMMRWDYETPEARFILSDGQSLWTWEPVYRQFCKQLLKASQLPSALSFLTGTGKIEDDFSVKLGKVNGNQVQLLLTPAEPSLAYESIQFEILMPSAKVYRATIYDAMGNFNQITFKSPEINAELDDNSFRFNPPSDARHICE